MLRKAGLIALAGVMFAQGCCNWDQENRDGAVTGGLIGAAGGMLIGSMTGSWVWGGLIGGSMGALAGYVIADNSKDKNADKGEYVASAGPSRLREDADREFKIAMEAKDPRSAEFHLKESIKLAPSPAAHNNLGIIQLQNGDRASARASFRSAILLDPGYDPALRNLEKLGA